MTETKPQQIERIRERITRADRAVARGTYEGNSRRDWVLSCAEARRARTILAKAEGVE